MKNFAPVGLLLLLTGCYSAPDDAVAALLLDSPPHPRLPSCLTVLGKDPSPALLAMLRAEKRNFVAGSSCAKGPHGGIYANGQRAESLAIHKFQRVVPWLATVECSSYVGPLGGSGWTVKLERINGIWIVSGSELRWISLGPNNSFKPKPLRGSA